jgi:hypothetical protein
VDPFAVAIAGLLAGLVGVLIFVGRRASGSGLEQLGLKTELEMPEGREALEAQDVEQMVAARSARREFGDGREYRSGSHEGP